MRNEIKYKWNIVGDKFKCNNNVIWIKLVKYCLFKIDDFFVKWVWEKFLCYYFR